jgi:tRNA (cmo5U34)-methyltransferase
MSWTESDSRLYQELAAVAVPDRDEQMATLLTLMPFASADAARVVELGCGEGRLSQALLEAFPQATVRALDGSADMLAVARARLAAFGPRAWPGSFDLGADDWLAHLDGADAVVSSLAVHHLDKSGKKRLFAAIAERLAPHGAVLIADLVEPVRPEARELFAAGWDRAVEHQARQPGGSGRAFRQFVETHWNVFRYPDPVDMPSPLFEQLCWLQSAGFQHVDCFWLRAGHAVYGGYRSRERMPGPPLAFAEALAISQRALSS